jgi:hypothetical protein
MIASWVRTENACTSPLEISIRKDRTRANVRRLFVKFARSVMLGKVLSCEDIFGLSTGFSLFAES